MTVEQLGQQEVQLPSFCRVEAGQQFVLHGIGMPLEAALRWLAEATPGSAEMLRLMDVTPIPCGQSAITAKRSDLYGWAGYGYCPSHSRWYWGSKLLLTGLWARIVQRLLALNACIWHNWMIGAPVKRSLIAYDH